MGYLFLSASRDLLVIDIVSRPGCGKVAEWLQAHCNIIRRGIFGATLQASQHVRSTALYRLRTPAAQIAPALLVINLGLSIADTAWLFHHSEVTLRLWLSRAGEHAEQVHTHFFQNLTLGHVQLDELYTTLRDKANDLWVWVAFDPATKLIPALQLGSRTQDSAYALLHALSQVLAPGCLPVF